jgi:N-formylglutamate amidohydrolase
MTIGSVVIVLHMPHLGTGIVVDILTNGHCRVLFDADDYVDAFHPLELELAPSEAKAA